MYASLASGVSKVEIWAKEASRGVLSHETVSRLLSRVQDEQSRAEASSHRRVSRPLDTRTLAYGTHLPHSVRLTAVGLGDVSRDVWDSPIMRAGSKPVRLSMSPCVALCPLQQDKTYVAILETSVGCHERTSALAAGARSLLRLPPLARSSIDPLAIFRLPALVELRLPLRVEPLNRVPSLVSATMPCWLNWHPSYFRTSRVILLILPVYRVSGPMPIPSATGV